ncbi:hypothetical protein Ddc_12205 [Ditylenchus destructor]|nr:hypothetical protein Ddc_12205 [Ditylenchus destructor]
MNGSIRKIEDRVLMSKDKHGGNYNRLKLWIYYFPCIIALSLAVPCVYVGWRSNKAINELWGHDNVKLVYVLVVKTGFILYGVFIGHVPLYIFMITVWSLNIEFLESNRRFKESQKTTIILNNEICMRVGSSRHSQNLIPILKTFAESIVQTHSGITVGGMVVIRKSTVLTCLSILVPYVVLFLQLHIGTTQ